MNERPAPPPDSVADPQPEPAPHPPPHPAPDAQVAGTDFREATRAQALCLGFTLARFTSADPLGAEVERRRARRLASGHMGSMRYLARPYPRRTHPRDLLPEARSVLMVAAAYYAGDHKDVDPEVGSALDPAVGARINVDAVGGKVARYAWGKDYHRVLRGRLDELGRWVEAEARGHGFAGRVYWRAFADSAPLDERSLAVRAGLGFIGKNTLLLNPDAGSWFLLAELLTSVPFAPDEPTAPGALHSCGSCRKCLDACPTGALVGPYELDARRCISYLTIEQKEAIPADLAAKMEGWAFGCDICQEVCPYNENPPRLQIEELSASHGVGPRVSDEIFEGIESKKAFIRRWGETPLERPGLDGMRRNIEAARESARGAPKSGAAG